jgi:exopolyphosphatase/guanosine-5'-triphosphate,3'-diphosphate pyrophosphatase
MTTVAIVDIGSNSVRLLIADKTDDNEITELDRQANVTRLGQGVDTSNKLADEAMERTYKVLADYAERIDAHDCDTRIAVLTSAVRDSANGQEFAQTIHDRYGLTPHVLKGDEEARLTYLGATSERDPADTTPTLVLDIGGGSTEIVIGVGAEVQFRVSTQAGVVRQSERHLHDDPPTAAQINAAVADVRTAIERARRDVPTHEAAAFVGVAGTVTTIVAIALGFDHYDAEAIHGSVITAEQVHEVTARLLAMTHDERAALPVMHPGRVDVIGGGALVLRTLVEATNAAEVIASEHDILDGIALSLLG